VWPGRARRHDSSTRRTRGSGANLECRDADARQDPAEKPEKNGHDLSEAARCLTELRDALIAERRAAGPNRESGERLMRLNAVISAIVGAHFPIGAIAWKSVEAARDAFAKLIAEMGLQGDGS
jgi:hypothetical protein